MSLEAEPIEHELELEQVLLQILKELRFQTLLMQEAFEMQDINKGDLDE